MRMKSSLALLLLGMLLLPLTVSAQPFTLVALNTIPGSNPANTADVLRFKFKKTGPLAPVGLAPCDRFSSPYVQACSRLAGRFQRALDNPHAPLQSRV